MKVAISIPDDDFYAAEAIVKLTNRPRSALYAEALREFISRRSPEYLTEAANMLADSLDDSDQHEIAVITAAGARTALANTEW